MACKLLYPMAKLGILMVLILAPVNCGSGWPPPNVILITLDTTRADRLGCYGYSLASTPVLDRFSEEAVLFENAVTPIPMTLPAHATILTGRTPLGHGVRDNGIFRLDEDVPILTERLAAAGYTTAAFLSAFPLHQRYGLQRGFQHYDDELEIERPAAETTARAIEWLQQNAVEPLFLWVHYFDPHDPWTPPEPFASATRGTPYDAEISAMDAGLGDLLAALTELGLREKAHIVIVADHGEGLDDHADYAGHGLLLYEEACRVPLLWHSPGQDRGRREPTLVGCVDIVPTLLDLLNLDPAEGTEGISLAALLAGRSLPDRDGLYYETLRPFFTYEWSPLYAWRAPEWKYIAAPAPELYHLASDPGEVNDLAAAQPARAQELRDSLRRYLERWQPADELAGLRELEPRERARLESLGYLTPKQSAQEQAVGRTPGLDQLAPLADPKEHVPFEETLVDVARARGRQRWDLVAEGCRTVLAAVPHSPVATLGLAEALADAGEDEEAMHWVRKYLSRRPDDPAAQEPLGDALFGLGRYREAAEAYARAAVEQAGTDLHRKRARTAVLLGEYAAARAEIDRVITAFGEIGPVESWRRMRAGVEVLARHGIERPAETDRDFAAQVRALGELGLVSAASALLDGTLPARADSLLFTLRGDVAYAGQEWALAAQQYDRALTAGARSPEIAQRRDQARRKQTQQERMLRLPWPPDR